MFVKSRQKVLVLKWQSPLVATLTATNAECVGKKKKTLAFKKILNFSKTSDIKSGENEDTSAIVQMYSL